MGKKGNTSKDLTQETRTSNEATAPGGSHRPRGKVGRLLKKLKEKLRLSDSRSRSAVPPDVDHQHASSTPNIIEVTPSDLEVEADVQSALRDAQEAAKQMHSLSGPVITVTSAAQDAQADLTAVDGFQDTYLKPLKIFDHVIGKIADVHPYAKMALGVLSCAAKIIIAQADRDAGVLKLLDKLCEVYSFMTQDEMLGKISSMSAILGKISQQTRECAQFIKDYSEISNFCEC
ncbi:uncharacterized protein EDB93DRAFT_1103260 [Suillus bovinus]|uniref:uncharacterized protein n=1 Tax=Suillus bovinus TaxID=48563 RepID=UPI001B872B44|nr:uncharacterized protein EDB93DRAFT_1103260 [Suillus bovinus]KAG2151029.1 hypothetical protein EDB93DRAFT_1103260 [Suillus bovinus]